MLKAKLDSVRKNKKGFSLIELIIVIAIMVALIAVMAPNFVKYVQKSRDTALSAAAEDFYSAVKVAYGDPDSDYTLPGTTGAAEEYVITVKVDWTDKTIKIDGALPTGAGESESDLDKLIKAAGVDEGKKMGTTSYLYTITITPGPNFQMTENSGGNPRT